MKKPSDIFLDALAESGMHGTCRATCQMCGVEHYASNAGYDFEDGEIEALDADANTVDHGQASVSMGYIDGKQVVVGCCDGVRKYEDFIVANRDVIVRFLKKRAERIKDNAEREAKLIEGLTS